MKKTLCWIIILSLCATISCEKAILSSDPENTAENNFEILWKDFDRYYALFDVKKVDWNTMYATYRPMVNANTTQEQLWNIVTNMLRQLNDPHIYITDLSKGFSSGYIQGRKMEDFDLNMVTRKYLQSGYQIVGQRNIVYGRIAGHNIGYIYVAVFTGDSEWPKDIDQAVAALADVNAMIVDIRANGGGTAENLQYIASAFIDREIVYLMMKARNGPRHSDFEEPWPVSIRPRPGKVQFTKKIALLTNRFSGSSSDHFAWIFKNYLPYTTQIGDTTVGNFGTVFDYRELPNRWMYRFSARLATSMEGVALDSLGGIVPDKLILNSKTDLAAGVDKVVEEAIRHLEEGNSDR
jgi:hypothetical protein